MNTLDLPFEIEVGSISFVRYEDKFQVVTINDTGHLH